MLQDSWGINTAIVAQRGGTQESILEGEEVLVCACLQRRGARVQNGPNHAAFQWGQLINAQRTASWRAVSLAVVH